MNTNNNRKINDEVADKLLMLLEEEGIFVFPKSINRNYAEFDGYVFSTYFGNRNGITYLHIIADEIPENDSEIQKYIEVAELDIALNKSAQCVDLMHYTDEYEFTFKIQKGGFKYTVFVTKTVIVITYTREGYSGQITRRFPLNLESEYSVYKAVSTLGYAGGMMLIAANSKEEAENTLKEYLGEEGEYGYPGYYQIKVDSEISGLTYKSNRPCVIDYSFHEG